MNANDANNQNIIEHVNANDANNQNIIEHVINTFQGTTRSIDVKTQALEI